MGVLMVRTLTRHDSLLMKADNGLSRFVLHHLNVFNNVTIPTRSNLPDTRHVGLLPSSLIFLQPIVMICDASMFSWLSLGVGERRSQDALYNGAKLNTSPRIPFSLERFLAGVVCGRVLHRQRPTLDSAASWIKSLRGLRWVRPCHALDMCVDADQSSCTSPEALTQSFIMILVSEIGASFLLSIIARESTETHRPAIPQGTRRFLSLQSWPHGIRE